MPNLPRFTLESHREHWIGSYHPSFLPSIDHQREPRRSPHLVLVRRRPLHHRIAPAGAGRPRGRRDGRRRRRVAPLRRARHALPHLLVLPPAHPEAPRPPLRPREAVPVSPALPCSLPLLLLLQLLEAELVEPEHEHGVPVAKTLEQPVVHVPRDLDRDAVDLDPLAPSEFPLQALHLQHPLAVDLEAQPRVGVRGAVDRDLPVLAAESRRRRESPAADHVVPPQDQSLGSPVGPPRLGPRARVLRAVAHEEHRLAADHHGHVVPGGRAGSGGTELGPREVPEDPGSAEVLGPALVPEGEGLDTEVEREGGGRGRLGRRRGGRRRGGVGVTAGDAVAAATAGGGGGGRGGGRVGEAELEGPADPGPGPGEGEDAEGSVVEAGGQVRFPGRRGSRVVVVVGGGGGAPAETAGEREGEGGHRRRAAGGGGRGLAFV